MHDGQTDFLEQRQTKGVCWQAAWEVQGWVDVLAARQTMAGWGSMQEPA
jgi:hypothetical protein